MNIIKRISKATAQWLFRPAEDDYYAGRQWVEDMEWVGLTEREIRRLLSARVSRGGWDEFEQGARDALCGWPPTN